MPAGNEKGATAISGSRPRCVPRLLPVPSSLGPFSFSLRDERGVGGPTFIPEPIRAGLLVVFILTHMHAYVYMHLKYSTVGP